MYLFYPRCYNVIDLVVQVIYRMAKDRKKRYEDLLMNLHINIFSGFRSSFLRTVKYIFCKLKIFFSVYTNEDLLRERKRAHDLIIEMRNENPIIESILQSQRYINNLKAIQLELPPRDRILIYAPHQDDETLGLGGTIIKCIEKGKTVKTIYVTNGAAGTKPTNGPALQKIRRKEALEVWSQLGGETPYFWDLPCRKIPIDNETAAEMAKQIQEFRPEIIFVPYFLEKPLDHRNTCKLLIRANEIKNLNEDIEIWSYQVTSMLTPNVVIDISDYIDRKNEINDMWISQNSTYNWSHCSYGLSAYNSVYSKKTSQFPKKGFYEVFFTLPSNEYCNLLKDCNY